MSRLSLGFLGLKILFLMTAANGVVVAADKLVGFQSARTRSQAMPWIADEAGLFRKYDLDFQLVSSTNRGRINNR